MITPLVFSVLAGAGRGPLAPPSNLYRSTYSGSRIQMNWTIGDPAAQTLLYENGVLVHTASAGVSSWASGLTSLGTMQAKHVKNGIATSLVDEV